MNKPTRIEFDQFGQDITLRVSFYEGGVGHTPVINLSDLAKAAPQDSELAWLIAKLKGEKAS